MINRKQFDISAYFVVGPENTQNRPVAKIVKDAIDGGFTCIQIRSKIASAVEMIQLTKEVADIISKANKSNEVTLLVNDRLDVILAGRKQGIKIDGIHVGQSDIPVDVCREYLGDDSIIGLSARTHELYEYIQSVDTHHLDYFGVGPLHETKTKIDCGLGLDGKVATRNLSELIELAKLSSIPIVVGGGVKIDDIPSLAQTGVDGFFVVSAISEQENPKLAASNLVKAWKHHNLNKTNN